MPTCFIAMPITTPEPATYHGDAEHFIHVLNHLFVPAVEAAGFTARSPLAQGSDVIHAEIIHHLETADLVLCDISGLNANVFFELGIRTAINRPVCLVRDNHTLKIPFDTTLINHYTYQSALSAWQLDADVKSLAAHIKSSAERSDGANPLWRHFGLSIPTKSAEGSTDAESKLTLLAQQIQALSQRIDPLTSLGLEESPEERRERVFRHLVEDAKRVGINAGIGGWGGNTIALLVDSIPDQLTGARLTAIARAIGFELIFRTK